MEAQTTPTNLDRRLPADLFRQYGGRLYEETIEEICRCVNVAEAFKTLEELAERAYRPHRRRPILSSDVGHFDVVDVSEVIEEAWELVEHGLLTEEDLRDFVFADPVRLPTALNPDRGLRASPPAAAVIPRSAVRPRPAAGFAAYGAWGR